MKPSEELKAYIEAEIIPRYGAFDAAHRTDHVRTIQYGTAHYPALSREGQFDRCVEHLQRKYAEGGYLRLWIPESDNARKLAELRALIHDTARLREAFGRIYEEVYRS